MAGSADEGRSGPDHARGEAAREHDGTTDADAAPEPRAERVKTRPDALPEAPDGAGAIEPVVVYDAAQRGIRGALNDLLAPATSAQRDQAQREREERQRRASLERERQRDRESGVGPGVDVDEPGAETDHASELAAAGQKKPPPLPSADRIEDLRRRSKGLNAEIMTADELEAARKADEARARQRTGGDDDWLDVAERAARSLSEKLTGKRELRVTDDAMFTKLRRGDS